MCYGCSWDKTKVWGASVIVMVTGYQAHQLQPKWHQWHFSDASVTVGWYQRLATYVASAHLTIASPVSICHCYHHGDVTPAIPSCTPVSTDNSCRHLCGTLSISHLIEDDFCHYRAVRGKILWTWPTFSTSLFKQKWHLLILWEWPEIMPDKVSVAGLNPNVMFLSQSTIIKKKNMIRFKSTI